MYWKQNEESPQGQASDARAAVRYRSWGPLYLALGAAILLLLALTLASAPADAQQATFGDTVDVRVVNVETVVTDKQGNRVYDLSPEDFRILVDGEEVPIEFFSEIRGGVVQGTEGAPERELRGTSYLVFVDEMFTIDRDRDRVLTKLQDQLAYLNDEDRMAVVAWNGRELEMISNWSSSPRELHRALTRSMARPVGGLHRLVEERTVRTSALDRLDAFRTRGPRGAFGDRLSIEERAYVERLHQQLENVVAGVTTALRTFADPPGRKVMMLVSGGWPMSPVDFTEGNPFSVVTEPGFDRTGSLYEPIVRTANILGYTLYPIDAPELEADLSRGADVGFASFDSARGPGLSSFREWERHGTLWMLAEETGGEALINGMGRTALQRVYEDTRSFYWLGFVPEWRADGRQRDIRVEVTRKGLRARARQSYSDLSPVQELQMVVESQLLFGNPAVDGTLDVAIGRAEDLRWGKVHLPILVEVPAESLTWLPVSEGVYRAELALVVAAKDQKGNRSDMAVVPMVFERDEELQPGQTLTYETKLKMRERDHDLVVALHDAAGGQVLSRSVTVEL